MKRLAIVAIAALLAVPAFAELPANFYKVDGPKVQDQYIIVLDSTVRAADFAPNIAAFTGGRVETVWSNALNGFLISGITERQAQNLARRTGVAYVEENGIVTASATQSNATWGIDRVDQRDLPLSGSYTYNYDAAGVHAYIIDTGVRASHSEFSGRMGNGYDFVSGDSNPDDCNGHGTHVAGTTAGTTYGIAKGATVHGVRVLDCNGSGTYAGVIDGINWVTNNRTNPAVANMSLGGGASSSVDDAVNNSVASGVFYAVAAGNDNADACNYSPARAADAFTVGSTTSSDARSSFSNYGTCLDIWAPGSSIKSAWYTSDTATNTISGTSMAAPHVAGAAALVRAQYPSLTAAQVGAELIARATCGRISDIKTGSPDAFLYTLDSADTTCGSEPPPPDPGDCPTGYTAYTGSIASGASNYHAQGSGSGTFHGILTCSGADVDLYLQKYGCSWFSCGFSDVASSLSSGCNEEITYSGTSGDYRWEVYGYSGSTSYTLCVNQP